MSNIPTSLKLRGASKKQISKMYNEIMKNYLLKNNRVFLSIIFSFFLVFFIIPFFMTPGKITRTVANFSKYFTPNFNPMLELGNPTTEEVFFNYPTTAPTTKPTGWVNQAATSTSVAPTKMITQRPTRPIQPTLPAVVLTKAGPTKRPKPSPTPLAPPEYLRPGTSLEDIFKKAGELSCVPPALLKAFVAQEAPGVLNWSDEQALFYNAYDWWHRVKEVKQVCAGYGFYTHTGLVAEDSMFAGQKCKDPFSPETANDTYSRLLGSCQMLRSYWEKDFKEPTRQKLKVNKVDRRVLIDCLVGYGIHFRKDSGYTGGCDNWALKDVAKAACVNTGISCDYYNYCYTICNNYNKFANKSFACGTASSYFVPGTCQFK